MLISLGAMLLSWVAFIWLFDPDGLHNIAHERSVPRNGKRSRYYQENDR
jgi:hypothetical protein